MTQRIHMREHAVVQRKLYFIQREAGLASHWIDAAHPMFGGAESLAIEGFFFADKMLQGYRLACLHQAGRLTGFFRGNQVECATLIIRAPSPPIGEFFLPLAQCLQRHFDRWMLSGRMGLEILSQGRG